MKSQTSKLIMASFFTLALSACGGGSSSNNSTTPGNGNNGNGGNSDTSFTKGNTSVPGLNAPENVTIVDAK